MSTVAKIAEFYMTCVLIYILGIAAGYIATRIHEWRNQK